MTVNTNGDQHVVNMHVTDNTYYFQDVRLPTRIATNTFYNQQTSQNAPASRVGILSVLFLFLVITIDTVPRRPSSLELSDTQV